MTIWDRVPTSVRDRCRELEDAAQFTDRVVGNLKEQMQQSVEERREKKLALVVAGSLGRKEAHQTSDVDAFVLFQTHSDNNSSVSDEVLMELRAAVMSLGLRMASSGAFSAHCAVDELLSNIGGRKESNDTLTRRLLLLTEGEGICPGSFIGDAKKAILKKYLADLQPGDDPRPIFLINDLIRYYRTICVDYEYKKNEAGKPWAVRLTKLRHSRKLLYFSALLPLLESIHKSPDSRLDWIEDQFLRFTPLERMILLLEVHGAPRDWELLVYYNEFVRFLGSEERRTRLDELVFDGREINPDYVAMRDNARQFRSVLNRFVYSVEEWGESIRKYVLS